MGHSRWNAPKAHGEHTGYGKTSRRDIPNKLRDCEPFDGFSMRARWEPTNSTPSLSEFSDHNDLHHGTYNIYSYDQRIAAYDPHDGTLHISDRYYSHKTSEHQNQAHVWTGRDFRNRDFTFGVQYIVVWEELEQPSYISELIEKG